VVVLVRELTRPRHFMFRMSELDVRRREHIKKTMSLLVDDYNVIRYDSELPGDPGRDFDVESQINLLQVCLGVRGLALDRNQIHTNRTINDKSGRPLLSWRVAILPFLGERKLFERFRLDEPWDSPHNKSLIREMPRAFKSTTPASNGMTRFLAPTGAGTFWPKDNSSQLIRSDAIAVVEVDVAHAVPWTQPIDLPNEFAESADFVVQHVPPKFWLGTIEPVGAASLKSTNLPEDFMVHFRREKYRVGLKPLVKPLPIVNRSRVP
ncbi:DUF1559 domain-containing protein, partial [Planctomycetota bacterium]